MIYCNCTSVFPLSRFAPAKKSAHIIQAVASGFVRPNHSQSSDTRAASYGAAHRDKISLWIV
jgi:hypothetical protein